MSYESIRRLRLVVGDPAKTKVDAMIMVPHIAKALAGAGAAKQIGKLNDYVEYQISTMITSVDNIENNPDMVKRFIRAYSKGIADMNAGLLDPNADAAEKEALTKILHKYVYVDRPYEKAAPSIQNGAMFLNEGASLNKTDVAKQIKWFQETGLVDSDLTIDQLIDSSFVEIN